MGLRWRSCILPQAITMIDKLVEYIIAAINLDFDDPMIVTEPQVVPGNIAFIDAFQESSANSTTDKLIASVVNISQEGALRNLPFRKAATNENGIPITNERSPEVWLNVYLLFGANRTDYISALNYISRVIGFFQRKHSFTTEELQEAVGDSVVVDLPNVNKIIFDIYSMGFEELSQLWGIIGGKYIPSVLYKVRLAVVQEAINSTARPIEAIGATPTGI